MGYLRLSSAIASYLAAKVRRVSMLTPDAVYPTVSMKDSISSERKCRPGMPQPRHRMPQPRQEREGVAAEREAADGNPPEADGEGAVR